MRLPESGRDAALGKPQLPDKRRPMMNKTLTALALVCALPFAAQATQQPRDTETLSYKAYIGGLPLGELRLGIARDVDAYSAMADFRMVALLRLVLDTDARAQVSGRLGADGPMPERFEYFVRDRDERRTTEILFDAVGNPATLNANPPFREKDYDMTLEQAAGAVDPATAVVALASPRAEPCKFNMDVFDGRKRHRILLIPESRQLGDQGEVICKGRYERVAGFKDKHMTPERRTYDFKVSFASEVDGKWRPNRVWASTEFGTAVVSRSQ